MEYDLSIPDEDYVFRQTTPRDRTGSKKRKYPNESHFQLKEGEKGLSVNWSRFITVEENFLLISITHSKSGIFLDHKMFRIFRYPVSIFRKIEKIEDVIHTPVYNGNPAPVGNPNNPAHAEVLYNNDIEIWVKLSDYCNNNFDDSYCDFDVNSIDEKSKELREHLNNTMFHRKNWDR